MRKVAIVTGPTCSGKTAKAISLALERGAEIISCDSVQIYRGMDVGSAKASMRERQIAAHHLLDVAEPTEPFDVAQYAELAKRALDDIFRRGKAAIVAGGSGFYLKAWFCAVADDVEIPQEVREFADKAEARGRQTLADELLKLDPDAGNFADLRNPRRTKNALMRCMASGLTLKELREKFSKKAPPFGELEREIFFLNPDDETLKKNISLRTRLMLENGLLDEAEKLLKIRARLNPSAASAIGYKEAMDFIESGKSDMAELASQICRNTFKLAKKQRKFFKSQLGLH